MSKLREAMKNKGLTVTKTGLALGVNPSLISQILAGNRYSYPKLRRRLAELVGVPETELFTEQGYLKEVERVVNNAKHTHGA